MINARNGLRNTALGTAWKLHPSEVGALMDSYYLLGTRDSIAVYFNNNGSVYAATYHRPGCHDRLGYRSKDKYETVSQWLRSEGR